MAEKEKSIRLRIRVINVRCPAGPSPDFTGLLRNKLRLPSLAIHSFAIIKRATDSRQRRIDFVYTLDADITIGSAHRKRVLQLKDVSPVAAPQTACAPAISKQLQRPVIVGAGPAGLFAAKALLDRGAFPVVIERGERIDGRVRSVEAFWRDGKLNDESNVLFGEGGAGTFSDGKLTTRIKSPLRHEVLKTLADYGAPSEILYLSKPHVGTDILRVIIPSLVDDLQRRGADFFFNCLLVDMQIAAGQLTAIRAGGKLHRTRHLFLATGHSARDIYRLLSVRGVRLEAKSFAVGLRIEHPQELINTGRKPLTCATDLGPADYFLTYRDERSGRGVYTFCMCPGGFVIACASAGGHLCTNGMSTSLRNSGWANAAIVATISREEFHCSQPLAGMELQEKLEKTAFQLGGGKFRAPVQRAVDFVSGRDACSAYRPVSCTYRPGVTETDLASLLPESIGQVLCRGLIAFDAKIPGYVSEGLLIGAETRTSSPVRIVRDGRSFQVPSARGLIPIGEGSGYAGGIMSSAVDGMRSVLNFDAT